MLTQLKGQIEYLVSCGARVTVITSPGPGSRDIMAISGVQHQEISIARAINLIQDLKSLFVLTRYFLKYRPDLVHSTTPKAGLLSAVSSRIAGIAIRLHTYTGQAWVEMVGPIKWLEASFLRQELPCPFSLNLKNLFATSPGCHIAAQTLEQVASAMF